jgi:mannose-6-phosphate isomerase
VRPEPTRIDPIFSPRLWGSHSLAPIYPEKTNLAEPLGEAWLTGVDCKIASGPLAGKTLGDAWSAMPGEWRGTRLNSRKDYPLLVKFMFPQEKLSIQVHPDDAYAAAHEQAAGGKGKTEMWHAVSSEPGAKLLLGLKPGTDKQKFLDAMKENTLEDIFQAHDVKAGDTFFVTPGTPHTIGPGMILCEVQEYSDLTYRVYDYGRVDKNGRARELHVAKALEVMKFGASQSRAAASAGRTSA